MDDGDAFKLLSPFPFLEKQNLTAIFTERISLYKTHIVQIQRLSDRWIHHKFYFTRERSSKTKKKQKKQKNQKKKKDKVASSVWFSVGFYYARNQTESTT